MILDFVTKFNFLSLKNYFVFSEFSHVKA